MAFIALFAPSSAAATRIDVEIFTDEFNNNGNCSLREAVQAANLDNAAGQMEPGCTAGTGVDTITVHAGTPYTLTTAIDGAPDIDDGDLEVTDAEGLIVQGEGRATTTIDGNDHDRIFDVTAGALAVISLTVTNGLDATLAGGGGIFSAGALTVVNTGVTFNQQTAAAGSGAGIALPNGGSLLASGDSHIDDNVAAGPGGGISKLDDGDVTLTPGVTVDRKHAVGFGGGVFVSGNLTALTVNGASVSDNSLLESGQVARGSGISYSGATGLHLTDATINGNDSVADAAGAAIDAFSTVPITIESSTVSGNTATGQNDAGGDIVGPAGIVSNDNAGTTISNSTISGNSTVGVDSEDAIFGAGVHAITPLTITGSTFALNTVASGPASSRGGAGLLIGFSVAPVEVINSTFTGNDATGAGGAGGAIQVSLNSSLTLGQSTFSGNMAPQGSAINSQGARAR